MLLMLILKMVMKGMSHVKSTLAGSITFPSSPQLRKKNGIALRAMQLLEAGVHHVFKAEDGRSLTDKAKVTETTMCQ